MNANPFIKPEVGQQAHTYISQYVPLPFEMMQKRAEGKQKVYDANQAAIGGLMGMLKVDTLTEPERQLANEKIGSYEKRLRDLSTGDLSNSQDLADLASEIHEDMTRGELAHYQSQYNKVFGKEGYADQIKKREEKGDITGDLGSLLLSHTINEYASKFDPKNPTKNTVSPYNINKEVDPIKRVQEQAGKIQAQSKEWFGDIKNVEYNIDTHQFLEYTSTGTRVVPPEKVSTVFNAMMKTDPELRAHMESNIYGLKGKEEYEKQMGEALAAVLGINVINDKKEQRHLTSYARGVDANGKPYKENADLGIQFSNPVVAVNAKDMFLGDPNAKQLDKYGELKADATQNLKASFATSFKSTMGLNSTPQTDVINSSIVRTMHAHKMFTKQSATSADMEEAFMHGIADGTITKVYDANGNDIYRNNKPAFIELKRKAETYHNQVEMANLQMKRAYRNAGITDKDMPTIELASRVSSDAEAVSNIFSANLDKLLKSYPIHGILMRSVAKGVAPTTAQAEQLLKIIPNGSYPTVRKLLTQLKESTTAATKTEHLTKKIEAELQTMAKTQETAQESQLSRVSLIDPKTNKVQSVNFTDILSEELTRHAGSLSSKTGTLSSPKEDGTNTMSFNEFIEFAAKSAPGYKEGDADKRDAIYNTVKKEIIGGVKLSGTKGKDGYYQSIFDYGGQQLHIPTAFGSGTTPENGFKINRTLGAEFASNIDAETSVADAIQSKMIFKPLGVIENGVALYGNSGNSMMKSDGTLAENLDIRIDLSKYVAAEYKNAYKDKNHVIPQGSVHEFVSKYNLIQAQSGSQVAKEFVRRYLINNGVLSESK